jgi:acetoacetyl-CoA synthetase
VTEIEEFWTSVWEFFEVKASKPYEKVLNSRKMSGGGWFEGAELNYAEHVFRNARPDAPAMLH